VIKDIVESGAATFGGDGAPGAEGKGGFPWPVKGRILEPLGIGKWDPSAPGFRTTGSPSRPSWAPRWLRWPTVRYRTRQTEGYGQIVILDHGGGYFTLYGHLNEVDCFKGQLLLQGDPIGTVGDSGSLTGPQFVLSSCGKTGCRSIPFRGSSTDG